MDEELKEDPQAATNDGLTEQTLPVRPKVSPLANTSFRISGISTIVVFFLIFYFCLVMNHWLLLHFIVLLIFVCYGVAGIYGIIGIISILISKGKLCGLKRNVLALLLTTFGLWLGVSLINIYVYGMNRMLSAARLRSLRNALLTYQNDYGCMPKEQWCDLLFQHIENVEKRDFYSPAAKGGECHYALNKHVIGYNNDIPVEVVVLFESKHAGWNQIGGAELMTTTECLPKGSWLYMWLAKAMGVESLSKGCYVCFGYGDVEFVKPEEYHTLRWHVP